MASILICDDAMVMRETLKKIVTAAGHEVVAEAGTGEECIQAYAIYRPDLVLMDITMPDMDGIDATREIVAKDKDAKIIMVSAMGQQGKVVASIDAGAKDFIVKPFETEKILKCIQRYI